ncbi:MAG TPA: isocitrate/isopropylmalate family dehydrogenase, partial [Actinomycetota bacterium]|nr:isocitrate/isopropylmalate family dehydrogenase [Actinomycetota bacterium]
MSLRVAVLRGDGIGPEVIGVALSELPSHYELVDIGASAERYLATGDLLTDEDLELISGCDALLLGAVGDPRIPDGVLEGGVLLRLRRELDLYVNLRPFPKLDLVFVRENTEGPYAGVGRRIDDSAFETSVNTASAIERCARYAFDLATTRAGTVTLVHKTNVLVHGGGLWREVVEGVA